MPKLTPKEIWTCAFCGDLAIPRPLRRTLSEARVCGCGAFGLMAIPADRDEVIDDVFSLFELEQPTPPAPPSAAPEETFIALEAQLKAHTARLNASLIRALAEAHLELREGRRDVLMFGGIRVGLYETLWARRIEP